MRPVFTNRQPVAATPQPGKEKKAESTTSTTTSTVSAPKETASVGLSSPHQEFKPSDNPPRVRQVSEPVKKVARTMSIFTTTAVPENHPSAQSTPVVTESDTASSESVVLDQITLLTAWKKMISISKEYDHATKMRLESVEPILIDNETIEIPVANPNVEEFLKGLRNQIINDLGSIVKKKLNINIRLMEIEGPGKILSKYEQLDMMIKLNPAIGRLKEELDLSLH